MWDFFDVDMLFYSHLSISHFLYRTGIHDVRNCQLNRLFTFVTAETGTFTTFDHQTTSMYNNCRVHGLIIWIAVMYLSFCVFMSPLDAFVFNKQKSSETSVTTRETVTVPVAVAHYTRPLLSGDLLQHHSHRIFITTRPTTRIQQRSTGDVDDATSKGIVSILTDVVNSIFDRWAIIFPRNATSTSLDERRNLFINSNMSVVATQQIQPPSSPLELLERIRNDYTERNYLWTGDLDVEANFVESCRFTDPTLSFVGTDKYIKNIQNLRPILNLVTDVEAECRSELIDIQLYDTYVQTRWNMIGTLSRLPWKPRIDVIGKTKFWYQNDTNQIYFYDEIWEIPANQALLQLVTPTNYNT